MEGETSEGEIEIEEGAKDLNFGISSPSKDVVDVLPVCCFQLAEPLMSCLVLLLSIVRREEAAIRKWKFSFSYERPTSDIYSKSLRELGQGAKKKKKEKKRCD